MTALLTGGTGKTATCVADFLKEAKIPCISASRSGETKFDYTDSSTYENPFKHGSISAVYLVAPGVPDPVPPMSDFIDLTVKKGVKRFVLIGGGTIEKGGHYIGGVWQHLDDIGVEYCVLRPTWFMENLSEKQFYSSIKNEGKIYTAFEDGKIPFVSATGIAAVAFHALTDRKAPAHDYRILGPELLTLTKYVAMKMSKVLGRDVVHVKLTGDEAVEYNLKIGFPESYAKWVSSLEVGTAKSGENRSNHVVEEVTGRPPQSFDAWLEENKKAWD